MNFGFPKKCCTLKLAKICVCCAALGCVELCTKKSLVLFHPFSNWNKEGEREECEKTNYIKHFCFVFLVVWHPLCLGFWLNLNWKSHCVRKSNLCNLWHLHVYIHVFFVLFCFMLCFWAFLSLLDSTVKGRKEGIGEEKGAQDQDRTTNLGCLKCWTAAHKAMALTCTCMFVPSKLHKFFF